MTPKLVSLARAEIVSPKYQGIKYQLSKLRQWETIMNDDSSHEKALASLDEKLYLVRDYVAGVALGYKHGLFLYGNGGIGKSYTVLRHLDLLDVAYELYNSRMTAKGLFLSLQKASDKVHILEDMERLTKDPDAQGVLRSALWSQPGHPRKVTWTTAGKPDKDGKDNFTFTGGLILISNRPLSDLPELRALATRIDVYRLEASDAELTSLMRNLATQGFRLNDQLVIGPEECLRITEYLLKECRSAGCPLDLRLQQKAFQSYRQHSADCSVLHWEDLVSASVREANCHFRHVPDTDTPEKKKAKRRNIVRELAAAGGSVKDQELAYTKQTGAARADFYRRKREVESGEFDESDLI